jgi:hypothetical protein
MEVEEEGHFKFSLPLSPHLNIPIFILFHAGSTSLEKR